MTSTGPERLARTAYEAHRAALPEPPPPWEEITEPDRQAWRAAMSAVADQGSHTLVEAVPAQSLVIQAGEERQIFHADFTAGRRGRLVIDDGFASSHHAHFSFVRGFWYVEDLGSTNGTWLNGRRIHSSQRLKKNDKIKIGHTTVTVVST